MTDGYTYGPDVRYRSEETGRGSEIRSVLLAASCPSCAADWSKPGTIRVGWSGGREYYCCGCGVFHRGVEVDEHGQPVPLRYQ